MSPDNLEDLRRKRAKLLARQVDGPSGFADIVGISTSYVSQIIGPHPRREIGERLARKIERAFNKPVGWLDGMSEEEDTQQKIHVDIEKLARLIHTATTMLNHHGAEIQEHKLAKILATAYEESTDEASENRILKTLIELVL